MIPRSRRRQDTLDKVRDLMARGQAQAAIALCTVALEDLGEDPSIRQARARALMMKRRHVEARRDLDTCLRQKPGAAEARRLLTELALRQGDLSTARRHLAEALRLDRSHPRALELAVVVDGWLRSARRHGVARLESARDTLVERRAA